MKILGVITARGGSKRIPGKNVKILGGKPLIAYTIEAALASCLYDTVISTDDDAIKKIASDFGISVIDRPADLALDSTPTLPVLQDVIRQYQGSIDALMTLQPTSPLRSTRHINDAIATFETGEYADSLVSVGRIRHTMAPGKAMVLDGQLLSSYSCPDSGHQTFFYRNGAIYITRIQALNDYIFGGKIKAYEMTEEESIDIDSPLDFSFAKYVIENLAR